MFLTKRKFSTKKHKKTKVITIKFIIRIIIKHNKCFGIVSFLFQTIDCMSSGFRIENVLNVLFFFIYMISKADIYLIHNEIRQLFLSTHLASLLNGLPTQSLIRLDFFVGTAVSVDVCLKKSVKISIFKSMHKAFEKLSNFVKSTVDIWNYIVVCMNIRVFFPGYCQLKFLNFPQIISNAYYRYHLNKKNWFDKLKSTIVFSSPIRVLIMIISCFIWIYFISKIKT